MYKKIVLKVIFWGTGSGGVVGKASIYKPLGAGSIPAEVVPTFPSSFYYSENLIPGVLKVCRRPWGSGILWG